VVTNGVLSGLLVPVGETLPGVAAVAVATPLPRELASEDATTVAPTALPLGDPAAGSPATLLVPDVEPATTAAAGVAAITALKLFTPWVTASVSQ